MKKILTTIILFLVWGNISFAGVEEVLKEIKKNKELFQGRDLNSTIDARSVYASAMSTVFDLDFKRIQKEVFWGEDLQNLSDKLFKA